MRSTGRPEMGNWMPSLVKERINRKVTVAADTKAARGPTAVGVPAQCALGTASLQNGTAVRLLPSRTGKARWCLQELPAPPATTSDLQELWVPPGEARWGAALEPAVSLSRFVFYINLLPPYCSGHLRNSPADKLESRH